MNWSKCNDLPTNFFLDYNRSLYLNMFYSFISFLWLFFFKYWLGQEKDRKQRQRKVITSEKVVFNYFLCWGKKQMVLKKYFNKKRKRKINLKAPPIAVLRKKSRHPRSLAKKKNKHFGKLIWIVREEIRRAFDFLKNINWLWEHCDGCQEVVAARNFRNASPKEK